MAGREPFPAVLRWALLGALGAFVLAFLLPLNVVMTPMACVPIALVVAVVITLKYGHFHI